MEKNDKQKKIVIKLRANGEKKNCGQRSLSIQIDTHNGAMVGYI